MEICEAAAGDAAAMHEILAELVAAGRRRSAGDAAHVLAHYIAHPHRLHCFAAREGEGRILGFQSLKCAWPGNPYATPVGWGIIGTHVRPSAARMGVGARLFAATLAAAPAAHLPAIEAYIGEENEAALAYYGAMGFAAWRRAAGAVCMRFELDAATRA